MKTISLFFLSVFFISCIRKEQPCSYFKIGIFVFHSKDLQIDYQFERSDSFQTEISKGGKSKWKIKWLNDCEYSLTYVNQHRNLSDTFPVIVSMKTLNFKIVKTAERFYIFSCQIPNTKEFIKDTVWKIR